MNKLKILITILCASATLVAQVPEPAKPQSEPIILMNGTAHLGNGDVITNSAIAFENGKITLVADATVIRIDLTKYKVISIEGQHVYPGLILPNTRLGLEEISAVRATLDYEETGSINPNVRSLVAYNTDSELIATLRFNGILLAQSTPEGGLVSGSSSVMMLDGWNWEDAAYKTDEGIHIDWPSKSYGARWWMGESQGRPNPNYQSNIDEIEKYLLDAKAYASLKSPETINLKLEASKGLFDGSKKIYLHADARPEIMESVQLVKKHGLKSIVLVGARDAVYTMDFLKEHKIPVLIDEVHRIPSREDEDADLSYKLPALLHNEGILVGLTYPSLHNSKNLPFFAGTVAAYGVNKETALQMVTSNTAKILGIDSTTGTIEVGKDANLVISGGDLLDMRTNDVNMAFITGRELNLPGKQQLLYERFKNKYTEDK
jgi:imidazolonepropionase-like amidohydrolase